MTSPLRLTSDAIHRLTLTSEPWLSCDDCFDELDVVVEAVLAHTGPLREEFRVHLAGCSVCRDEAISLATLAAPDHGLDPGRAAMLLESAVTGVTDDGAGSI